ncbi:MAG: hypothetical protein AAGM16_13015 [Pseudomonadota bacterium]
MEERDVVPEDLEQIDALIEDGAFDEALKRHLWFYEASRTTPGMGGVRLSYALDSWLTLAQLYQPAMDALVETKDRNKHALIDGHGAFDEFHDVYAINHYLENESETYDVFASLHENYPDTSRRCYTVVQELLIERGEYDLCASYIDNPLKQDEKIERLHRVNLNYAAKRVGPSDREFDEWTRESYVSQVTQLIEILSRSSNSGVAKQVQSRALSYMDSTEIRDAI